MILGNILFMAYECIDDIIPPQAEYPVEGLF